MRHCSRIHFRRGVSCGQVSGGIGTALFYVTYEMMLLVIPSVALAWTLSYLLSVIWQHALHSFLVFGFPRNYVRSLLGVYAAYTLSILLSSGVAFVADSWEVPPRITFVVSTVATGIVNFFTVKSAFGETDSATDKRTKEK